MQDNNGYPSMSQRNDNTHIFLSHAHNRVFHTINIFQPVDIPCNNVHFSHFSHSPQKAKEMMTEIGGDVARFCLEGQVILAGDWNCKVGELVSTARERVFARKSVSKRVDREVGG